MKLRRLARVGATMVLVGATTSAAFAVTDEERAGARAAASEGQKAFDEGRFAEAVDFFARAESLVHAVPHLVYLGRSYAKLGKLVKAREAYLKAKREQLADDAPAAIKAARDAAIAELPAVEARLGRLTIIVEGAGTKTPRVALDGAAVPAALLGVPYPADPGAHTLVAEAEGLKSAPVEVTLSEGGSENVVLKLEPSSEAPSIPQEPAGGGTGISTDDLKKPSGLSTMRLGSYISFGVGAVGLGLGTYFLLDGNKKSADADSLADSCEPNCTPTQQKEVLSVDDEASSAKTAATVGFIVGGVGVAAGVTLLVLDLKREEKATGPSVRPWVGLNSAGVFGTF
ncbi:MAG TPA: hypothetical protein PKD61_04350 [Polyangiaceae bacterium]|nr:hypothetical protein [Polyangiaceae bacterium]